MAKKTRKHGKKAAKKKDFLEQLNNFDKEVDEKFKKMKL